MASLGTELSRVLAARGVEVVFGVPGVHNIEMYRGISAAGITHVLARHEGGAAFMADGYARASGKPGVCFTITGPGLTNAMTGLGQAYSDSVPVLCLSSSLDETGARRGQLHQMRDQRGAAASVCDWAATAVTAEAAFALIDRAFAEFSSKRPRPKYIDVPLGLARREAAAAPPPGVAPGLPKPSYAQISDAVARLLAARKPLFVIGGGASGACVAIGPLLRMTGAAALTTVAGRGLVPEDWPLNFGAPLYRASAADVLAEADLIIFVGTELAEVDLGRTHPGHTGPALHIDIDPEVLARAAPGDLVLHADAAVVLGAMCVAIPARAEDQALKWDPAHVCRMRARWRAEVDTLYPGLSRLCDTLRAVVPEDSLIYSDMTQIAYAATELWDMAQPGLWHHPSGFGTLGYALPAAIGGAIAARFARRAGPVFCLAGDYGLQYNLQELATAVDLGLPVVILLWDNTALQEISDAMVAAQIPPDATRVRNPDFLMLARAYGCAAVEPETLAALQDALRAALAAEGPTLIRMTPRLVT